ncbi:50S ribosomal protein L3 [bacterium]|nr:50S ribosomal protein L3 [bacterium]
MKAILGRKIGMMTYFTETGEALPVTVVQSGPCIVVQKKTLDKDGYEAIQIGFEEAKPKRLNKPLLGHFKKANVTPCKYLKEIRGSFEDLDVGSEIRVDIFSKGELVDVVGISKGKGFAGVIKRWGFSGGPASHGSMSHRRPASAGPQQPQRIIKGKKMPGHMGAERVTVQNLEIVDVDPEKNLLLIKGGVPGPKGSVVLIRQAKKSILQELAKKGE